ncbi:hypothetical protein HJG60_011632 [Phyllostomus discolor]|uniref:Uncharacterized protein n=1 Tax=Phyllostomus discolor TaxID=89673 RepID=A0A833ZVQ0_9CHIR|nr:hypothetical protein HJG60_011632 [Phyllostomus discolor]
MVPSSKPSTAPKVTGGFQELGSWGCWAFHLDSPEDCTGLAQDGEICSPRKHSQRGCDRKVVAVVGGTGSRGHSRPDFWLHSQPCRADSQTRGLRVCSLGTASHSHCSLLLLLTVDHLGSGL